MADVVFWKSYSSGHKFKSNQYFCTKYFDFERVIPGLQIDVNYIPIPYCKTEISRKYFKYLNFLTL